MKLLWVLPRFGREITGGAEAYARRLLGELIRRGHEATVLTTLSDRIDVRAGYLVEWPQRQDLPLVEAWDGIPIERYPVPPATLSDRALALLLAPFERRRRQRLDQRLRGSLCFSEGWWAPEIFGDSRVMWSARRSLVRPPGTGAVCLEVMAPRGGRLAWRSDSGAAAAQRLRPWTWEPVRIPPQPKGDIALRFAGTLWPQRGRALAFAVRRARVWNGGAPRELFGRGAHETRDPCESVRDLIRSGEGRHVFEELGSRRLRGPSSPALLARLAERLPAADAVVAGYQPFTLAADVQRLCRDSRRPCLLLPFAHAGDSTHHFRWHYGLLRGADGVLALSEFNRVHFFDAVGARGIFVGGGPSHVCSRAFSEQEVAAFRRGLGIRDESVVLTVARKTAYKGYPELLEAVTESNRRGTRMLLLWVGPDEDGRRIDSPFWRHAGRLSDEQLCLAYRASDMFCLFSEHESFGMVVLDAWAHGLPAIVNRRCGPTAELVEDGRTGLHAEAHDLPRALGRLAGDPDLRRRLGEAGRDALATRHTWSAAADRLEAALARATGGGRQA
jgi:glycosyltransferase involved in cell wall biosynthesis